MWTLLFQLEAGDRKYIRVGLNSPAPNSVFIKLWLDVKHSTINHYFAFVVN